ncbi:hypothetical protein PMAYCL1PPCAC_22157 [Pristionchus mayeri]|uniref:Uncharacterized protein n=1 Tax=Pristionchus mayeri TaxID=1317129 RepID=A0AAN5CWQ9_9BILA|nr:hypothetical protein PMAYCL1PPCAC_22157 [Pristionchus mayeri]
MIRGALLLSLFVLAASAGDFEEKHNKEAMINAVGIIRNAAKYLEGVYDEQFKGPVPASDVDDDTNFTPGLAHLALFQAVKKLVPGMEMNDLPEVHELNRIVEYLSKMGVDN